MQMQQLEADSYNETLSKSELRHADISISDNYFEHENGSTSPITTK